MRVWHKPTHVYGVTLRVLACQNAFGQTLFLAYQGHAEKALKRYAALDRRKHASGAEIRGFFLKART